jgi:hypothetical protein
VNAGKAAPVIAWESIKFIKVAKLRFTFNALLMAAACTGDLAPRRG